VVVTGRMSGLTYRMMSTILTETYSRTNNILQRQGAYEAPQGKLPAPPAELPGRFPSAASAGVWLGERGRVWYIRGSPIEAGRGAGPAVGTRTC